MDNKYQSTESPYSDDVIEGTWCPSDCPWMTVSYNGNEGVDYYCRLMRCPVPFYDGDLAVCAINSSHDFVYGLRTEDVFNSTY